MLNLVVGSFIMLRTARESALVAFTHLALIAVQKEINAIMKTLRETFSGVIAEVV